MFEKAVHMGVPMSKTGLCSSMSLSAFFLIAGSLKSQGLSSSSLPERSSARPGRMPMYERRFAIAVTLGAE